MCGCIPTTKATPHCSVLECKVLGHEIAQCCKVCCATTGHSCYCRMVMIYTRIWLATMKNKWLILFYWKQINYMMMSFEFLSNVYWDYCKLIPCTLTGNLQRKPPKYLGLAWTDANDNHLMMHCLGRPEGLESLVTLPGKSLCLKFCLASIFPISQPQGWKRF